MKATALSFCAALVVLVGVTQSAHAQFGHRLRSLFYDPDAYDRRYSYQLGNPINLNATFSNYGVTAEQYRYQDYLDRADRAEKFGYRMPVDPYFETPPADLAAPPASAPVGPGFRIFRRWR